MRGPQSAGLLMGRKEIVAAARLSMPPRGFNVGRGMKVNKEEVLAMYVALDKYIHQDHDKEWKEWEAATEHIENSIKSIKGVLTKVTVPALGNITPTLNISWDEKLKLSGKELQEKLRNGSPSIEIGGVKDGEELASVELPVVGLASAVVEHKRVGSRSGGVERVLIAGDHGRRRRWERSVWRYRRRKR